MVEEVTAQLLFIMSLCYPLIRGRHAAPACLRQGYWFHSWSSSCWVFAAAQAATPVSECVIAENWNDFTGGVMSDRHP